MKREQEEALQVSLTKAIRAWTEDTEIQDDLADIGWMSENVVGLMGRAAMSVLIAQHDLNEYLRDEGQLKND